LRIAHRLLVPAGAEPKGEAPTLGTRPEKPPLARLAKPLLPPARLAKPPPAEANPPPVLPKPEPEGRLMVVGAALLPNEGVPKPLPAEPRGVVEPKAGWPKAGEPNVGGVVEAPKLVEPNVGDELTVGRVAEVPNRAGPDEEPKEEDAGAELNNPPVPAGLVEDLKPNNPPSEELPKMNPEKAPEELGSEELPKLNPEKAPEELPE